MTDWIYRVDFSGLDATGAATAFSYSTVPYATTASHPTKPNAQFDDRLVQPLLFRRDLYGQGRTYGDVEIPVGTIVLQNADGALDTLKDYGFDAQSIRMYKVDPAAPNTDLLEFDGVMEQATLDQDALTILVRDLTYIFDRALQPTKFLGNNVAPDGLEGSSDLQGVPKPICLGGLIKNIEPVSVNTSRLIYQIHDNLVWPDFYLNTIGSGPNEIPWWFGRRFYDAGVIIKYGTSRTLTEMQSGAASFTVSSINTSTDIITFTTNHSFSTGDLVHISSTGTYPATTNGNRYYFVRVFAANQVKLYDTQSAANLNSAAIVMFSIGSGTITIATNRTAFGMWDGCSSSSGSYVRLGSTPTGRITMDMVNYGSASATAGYWYEALANLLARVGTFSLDNRITSTDYKVGHFWTQETTVYQAIRDVLRNVNGSYQLYPNRAGLSPVYLTVQRLQAPLGTSRFDIDEGNLIFGSFKKIKQGDKERGIPPWRINTRFNKNYTVMVASEITDKNIVASFSFEYQARQADVSAIKLKYPASPELTFDTNLKDFGDADSIGSYLSGLFSTTSRGMYTLDVSIPDLDGLTYTSGGLTIPGLMLGDTVKVTYPRFGFNAGSFLVVLGAELDYARQICSLVLWG